MTGKVLGLVAVVAVADITAAVDRAAQEVGQLLQIQQVQQDNQAQAEYLEQVVTEAVDIPIQ